jgi:ABC-type multidrug transport system fused ATPase/permease subunit
VVITRLRKINSRFQHLRIFLPKIGRVRALLLIGVQLFLSVLDLLAVGLIGIVGALSISGIQSQPPAGKIKQVLDIASLGDFSFQTQVAILGGIAAMLFISKTLLNIWISRRVLNYLSFQSALMSSQIIKKLMTQEPSFVQSYGRQSLSFSVGDGVNSLCLGVLGTFILLISDGLLLVVMFAGLLYVDPIVAIVTMSFFSAIAVVLHLYLGVAVQSLGMKSNEVSVSANEKIIEAIDLYKTLFVMNGRSGYADLISEKRFEVGRLVSRMTFIPSIGKYVLESSFILGAVIICAIEFLLTDAANAFSVLSVFMAAGSRIAPAILRVQQSSLTIKNQIGHANQTIALIERLNFLDNSESLNFNPTETKENGIEEEIISLEAVSFKFQDSKIPLLSNVTFSIKHGMNLAITGASGVGKSTLAELILGLLPPTSGNILVNGLNPRSMISSCPGFLAYVPQDVVVIKGTIAQNISLELQNESNLEQIWRALERAKLDDFVRGLPLGLETPILELGLNLSGGQKQRIGIARALFQEPKVLVLDEATSSLDGETELAISKSLDMLKGEVTLVVIAHRLSTVRSADTVIFLENGCIADMGTFEEIRNRNSNFQNQALLMGL